MEMKLKENVSLEGEFKVPKMDGLEGEDMDVVGYANATFRTSDLNIHIETRIFEKELANKNKELIKLQYEEFIKLVNRRGLELGMIFF